MKYMYGLISMHFVIVTELSDDNRVLALQSHFDIHAIKD